MFLLLKIIKFFRKPTPSAKKLNEEYKKLKRKNKLKYYRKP